MNEDFLHPDHLITGNEINELRFLLGLTQKEFADRLGVNVGTVCQWECNGAGLIQARYPNQCMIKLLYADAHDGNYSVKNDAEFRAIARKLFHV